MKRCVTFTVSFLLLLFAVGCGNRNQQSPEEPVSKPTTLTVSNLNDIFASTDFSSADITFFCSGTEDTVSARNAIRRESYIEKLGGFTWESYQPPAEWDGTDDYRYQLTIRGVTLTAFQSGYANSRPLHVVTDSGEGWFTLPYISGEQGEPPEQVSWMIFEAFEQWYNEAHAAALYGGKGTPLTPEELDWFQEYTASDRTYYDETRGVSVCGATPISCFFTSRYSDPRDMTASEFLWYCPGPGGQEPVDENEFRYVQTKLDWRSGDDDHLFTLDELPVPCHRLPRSYINKILANYAGITVEEMHTDWLEESFYIPETDCFYTFTSDFGPGTFALCYGEKNGDIVTLWENFNWYDENSDVLTLQKRGEIWQVLSHQPAAIS